MSWYRKVFERIAPHYFRTAFRIISLVLVLPVLILYAAYELFDVELLSSIGAGWFPIFLLSFQFIPVVFESHLAIDDFLVHKDRGKNLQMLFRIMAGIWFSICIFIIFTTIYSRYACFQTPLSIAFLVYIPLIFILGMISLIKLEITPGEKMFRASLIFLYLLDVCFIIL